MYSLSLTEATDLLQRHLSVYDARITQIVNHDSDRKHSKYIFTVKLNGTHFNRTYRVLAGEKPSVFEVNLHVADTSVKAINVLLAWLGVRCRTIQTVEDFVAEKGYFKIKIAQIGRWFWVYDDGTVKDIEGVFEF